MQRTYNFRNTSLGTATRKVLFTSLGDNYCSRLTHKDSRSAVHSVNADTLKPV